jgi:hypothetical protein
MKRIIIIFGIGIILLGLIGYSALYIWIGKDVKENIILAEEIYDLKGEDAVIAFLLDESNSIYDRTHKAIWTLGMIKSQKSLLILGGYYRNDPEGKTCYGQHAEKLCQYEIHKAIISIEKGGFLSYSRLR